VFVGNAWDPQEGRETPWIDIARQLAGDKGVEELGPRQDHAARAPRRSRGSSRRPKRRCCCCSTRC
jgi:hypothetical protein